MRLGFGTFLRLATFAVLALPAACLKGPSFFKQNGVQPALEVPVVSVAMREENGAATGTIVPRDDVAQLVQASTSSNIAGATAVFPPGAVAIATEITIGPGELIATDSTLSNLEISSGLAATAPSVAITPRSDKE